VIILAHHLVSDRPHPIGMPTSVFWQAIRFLNKHYQIVSLSEAMRLLSSGNVSTPTLVITFDDGYGENFVSLRAVAAETGVPVAMFVSTEPVNENREFEHDLVRHNTGALPLTWDQIRYWNQQGAEFGSHTRTHFDCGSNDQAKLEWEIKGSRQEMEEHLGKQVDFFAFPFGKKQNISRDAVKIASTTYSHFASCFGGDNVPDKSLRRQHVFRKSFYTNPWELELEIQSVFAFVDRMKDIFHLAEILSPNKTRELDHSLPISVN
jgi:peptidoglycan/xylan/chitin deacetylase (PgdA/CDA1 family)